jgi:hypothetical protein
MGVWQGVSMDSLKYHSSSPCPTLLRPAGGPPLKRLVWSYGRLLLPWTPARRTPMFTCGPNGIERIGQLDASFRHFEEEHGQTGGADGKKMAPVRHHIVVLGHARLHVVFSEINDPEGQKNCVKDSCKRIKIL